MIAVGILILVFGSYFVLTNKGSKVALTNIKGENLSSPYNTKNYNTPTITEKKDSLPLYIENKDIIDPFSKKNLKEKKLENALKLKQKEIELLKAQIEELKLKKEITKLGGSSNLSGFHSAGSSGIINLLGTIVVGNKRKAYLSVGERKIWLQSGEKYGNLKLISVSEKSVLVSINGKFFTLSLASGLYAKKEKTETEKGPINQGEKTK